MCLAGNSQWVFQFKNSILSKIVGPTKINAKQNASSPLHIFISLNKTQWLQPKDKRRMQSEKKKKKEALISLNKP